ncbi:MAG: LysM peptidoglycan-binding domain-containing protein [Phycisphaerae bacterium]|nr:LysM peptidoglycan-binding domain-containing protein [Phycisphaerae bacterium]
MKFVRFAAMLAGVSLLILAVGCNKPEKPNDGQAMQLEKPPETFPLNTIPDNNSADHAPMASVQPAPAPSPYEQPITTITPEPDHAKSSKSAKATPAHNETKSANVTKSTSAKPKEKYAAAEKAGGKAYVVKKGDTLQTISKQHYGTTKHWKKILHANKGVIKDPNKLVVGTKIKIP